MTPKHCDHTSVGMLVWQEDKLLFIERMKFPFGFAPPAGHVDEHGSFEDAARTELKEEVGLETTALELLLEGRYENPCRREDGTWHYWKIYKTEAKGDLNRSHTETKQATWLNHEELVKLAKRTIDYKAGIITDEEWQKSPGLEPIWYDFLKELKLL